MKKLSKLLLIFAVTLLSPCAVLGSVSPHVSSYSTSLPAPTSIRHVWTPCGKYFVQVATYLGESVVSYSLGFTLYGNDGTVENVVVGHNLIIFVEDESREVPEIAITPRTQRTLVDSPFWVTLRMDQKEKVVVLRCLSLP